MKLKWYFGIIAVCALLSVASAAVAEEPPEIEIDVAPDGIADTLRPDPDSDSVDTAAIFTSNRGRALVRCKAYSAEGVAIGRVRFWVPDKGVRFVRASTVAGGIDYLGHMVCWAAGNLDGSAVLVAPGGLTAVPVKDSQNGFGLQYFRIPVVASF